MRRGAELREKIGLAMLAILLGMTQIPSPPALADQNIIISAKGSAAMPAPFHLGHDDLPPLHFGLEMA